MVRWLGILVGALRSCARRETDPTNKWKAQPGDVGEFGREDNEVDGHRNTLKPAVAVRLQRL